MFSQTPPDGVMSRDKKTPWPPVWAVLIALAAIAIVVCAVWWVLDARFPDRHLPPPRLEVRPGNGRATLQWIFDVPDELDYTNVKWQYDQRYAERENEYNPPARWKSVPTNRVVTGLANDWGYVFRVRAVLHGRPGPPSNEATVTPTAVPVGLENIAEQIRALRQSMAIPSPPAPDDWLAGIEDQLTRIEIGLTAILPTLLTGDQWTALMNQLAAIEAHLETIASRIRSTERTTIPRVLTLFRFPNARLAATRVPAGDGVIVPEHAVIRAMAALDGCARPGEPVTVRPYGFVSKAPFRYADGTQMEDSDGLNLKTAHLRARDACSALRERADAHPHVRIEEPHKWSSLDQMSRRRDDGSLITYPDDTRNREPWRRAVVLKVVAPGRCKFE